MLSLSDMKCRNAMQLSGWIVAATLLAGLQVSSGQTAQAQEDSTATAQLRQWRQWRGAESAGSVDDGVWPDRLDPKTNLLWETPLPGKGCSTPIVVDGKIILTTPDDAGNDAVACFAGDGQRLWQTAFGEQVAGRHRSGSGSNASPVSDGEGVFVYFKSGTFAALEPDGTIRWQLDLVKLYGKDTLFWDHGTSPVLTENAVVMTRMHHGESWLASFDKVTGELNWKTPRNYDIPRECDNGYTTPIVMNYLGKRSILTWGAEHVTVHDAATGKLIVNVGGFNPDKTPLWPIIASPVLVDGLVVVATGRNDRGLPRLHGIRLKQDGDADDLEQHQWDRDDIGTFVPTPVVYRGHVFLVRDKGEVECLDPKTGESIWRERMPKERANFFSSPLIAGGKLYAVREDGNAYVAEISEASFDLVAENDLKQSVIASPVPMDGKILIRGEKSLFCFGGDEG